MELKADPWNTNSLLLTHPEVRLRSLQISPNLLVGEIRRIAQILKNAHADPANKKTIKIVRLCWEQACELPTGKKVIRACNECLGLPATEDSQAKTRYFTFKMDDGATLSFPTYIKNALAADFPYFRALFTNGTIENNSDETPIHGVSSEAFEKSMKSWLTKTTKDFCVEETSPEQNFLLELVRWEMIYEKKFEDINEVVDQILRFPSKAIKVALCQFFLNLYVRNESKKIKALCESYLRQLLNVPALSRQIKVDLKFLSSVLVLPNRGWSVTNSSGEFELPKYPESQDPDEALGMLATCSGIHSLDATGCVEITDEVLMQIAKNPHIKTLVLEKCKSLADEDVMGLADSNITHLNLNFCKKLTDKSIRKLAKSMPLVILKLQDCKNLTDRSLSALASNQTLVGLDARDCKSLTHAGIKSLARNKNLRRLKLSYFHDSLIDEGIIDLAKKAKLTHLELYSCKNLSDRSVIALAQNLSLTHLDVSMCKKLTDKSLFALANAFQLTFLDVSYTNITDEGILSLLQNSNLKFLSVLGCKNLTARSFNALKQYPQINYKA